MRRRLRRAAETAEAVWLLACLASLRLGRRERVALLEAQRSLQRVELEELRRVAGARLRVEIAPGVPVMDVDLHSLCLSARFGGYGVTGGARAGYRVAEVVTVAGRTPLVISLEVKA